MEEVEQSPASKVRAELKNSIISYYYRTDISVNFAGRKGYVMVKGDSVKRTKMVKSCAGPCPSGRPTVCSARRS